MAENGKLQNRKTESGETERIKEVKLGIEELGKLKHGKVRNSEELMPLGGPAPRGGRHCIPPQPNWESGKLQGGGTGKLENREN